MKRSKAQQERIITQQERLVTHLEQFNAFVLEENEELRRGTGHPGAANPWCVDGLTRGSENPR